MHLTRAEISRVMPLPRKGTRYVARPLAYTNRSLSVLSAVRDLLHLARTAREVKEMIKEKKLKINGRVVRDERESLTLFSLFEADHVYKVTLLPTRRFALEPTKHATRVAKVINKRLLRGNIVQINLHDGTNLLTKDKIAVGDSIELDLHLKIVKIIPLKEGAKVLVGLGRNAGSIGIVKQLDGERIRVLIGDRTVSLKKTQVIAQ